VPGRAALERAHALGELTLALTETRLGQLPDRRAPRPPMLAGVSVHSRKELIRKLGVGTLSKQWLMSAGLTGRPPY
jgi:hypothetical protein